MLRMGVRAWIFYCVMNIFVVASVWMAADRIGLLWIVPIMLSINLILLTYGQVLHFLNLKAEPIKNFEQWPAAKTLQQKSIQPLVQQLEIPMPKFWLLKTDTLQAITVGIRPNDTRIYLSRGLLEKMSEQELLAIVTQQLVATHYQAGIGFYFVAALSDLLCRFGNIFDRTTSWIFGLKLSLSNWLIAPLIRILQVCLIPKDIYNKIDRKTAELLANPQDLARALWKMESYSKTYPLIENQYVLSHACSVHPLPETKPLKWLRTHPDMKSRIKNLTGYFPI